MTQIPVSSINGGSNSPATITSTLKTSAPGATTRAPDIRSLPMDNIRRRTQQLDQWHQVDRLQKDFQKLDRLESAINTYRSGLGSITRLLTNRAPESQVAQAIDGFSSRVQADKVLDLNLLSKPQSIAQSYQVKGLNLVETRSQDETLAVGLPNGEQTSFRLTADAPASDNLVALQQAFSGSQAAPGMKDGAVVFSGANELMSSPWLFQGEDVRVPRAGVRLPMQELTLLDTMRNQVDSGNYDGAKNSVRTLYRNLEQETGLAEQRKSELTQKTQSLGLNRAISIEDIQPDREKMNQILQDRNFANQIQAFRAQANVSKERVISTLTR